MDRAHLQDRLSAQSVPARVARRALWMEMREAGGWRRDLVKALDLIRLQGE